MTGKLVLANMRHKPMRSLLSILLIGVPVTLILCLVGLSEGLLQDSQNRARGVGADIVVRGSNATSAISFSGASMDERLIGFLEKQPHVKLAMGVIGHPIDVPLVMTGIDLARFNQMSGGFTYSQGGPFRGPDDMIVDKLYAAQKNLHTGDTVVLVNHSWRIAGIHEGGKLTRIAVPLKTLQDLDSATGKVSQIFVKLDDPARANAVAEALRQVLPGHPISTMEEWTAMFNVNNIHGLKEFIYVIMGIGIVIGFAVVCLSMYMAVLQRTREIGILKSIGGSKAFILRIILIEALALGLGGTALGIVMSYGAYWAIATFEPASIPMIIVYAWWPRACLLTLVGTGLGSLYPGWSAARHDPIEALAYE
ncbi:MAG: ABC transporter permease [Acidobacteriia bacterium]|nr:ABC transporter permease [Terriglobia bacterium]